MANDKLWLLESLEMDEKGEFRPIGTWYNGIDKDFEEIKKSAIQALESQDSDCVSRQAVLDINESHHGQMGNDVNHQIWKEIKALPSVTPKQTGKIRDLQFSNIDR